MKKTLTQTQPNGEEKLSAAQAKKVAERMAAIISYIDSVIATTNDGDERKILSFEKIKEFIKTKNHPNSSVYVGLSTIAKFLSDKKDKRFGKYSAFFKKVHGIIRKKAEAHRSYKDNLILINENNFKCTSRVFSKYANMYSFYPMTYDDAHMAYQKLLDEYDPNKSGTDGYNWQGFTALIETNDGEVTTCYLGESRNVETFYKYLTEILVDKAKTAIRLAMGGNLPPNRFISIPCDSKQVMEIYNDIKGFYADGNYQGAKTKVKHKSKSKK